MNLLDKSRLPQFEAGKGISANQLNALSQAIGNLIDQVNALISSQYDVNVETDTMSASYTLETAINAVPENRRAVGMKIRFKKGDGDNNSANNIYVEYSYIGTSVEPGDFTNLSNWVSGVDIIDGGEF